MWNHTIHDHWGRLARLTRLEAPGEKQPWPFQTNGSCAAAGVSSSRGQYAMLIGSAALGELTYNHHGERHQAPASSGDAHQWTVQVHHSSSNFGALRSFEVSYFWGSSNPFPIYIELHHVLNLFWRTPVYWTWGPRAGNIGFRVCKWGIIVRGRCDCNWRTEGFETAPRRNSHVWSLFQVMVGIAMRMVHLVHGCSILSPHQINHIYLHIYGRHRFWDTRIAQETHRVPCDQYPVAPVFANTSECTITLFTFPAHEAIAAVDVGPSLHMQSSA